MENQTLQSKDSDSSESFSIKNFLKACAQKWHWLLVSAVVFTALGYAYVITREPVYQRSMDILVKDQSSGGGVGDIAGSFASLGLVSSNTNVNNELIALLSPAVMSEVVSRLDLDMTYRLKGFPHGTMLYGSNLPFTVKFVDLNEREAGQFKMDIQPDGSARLYKFNKISKGEIWKYDGEVRIKPGQKVASTPVGKVEFLANPRYTGTGFDEPATMVIAKKTFMGTVESYAARVKGDLVNRDAQIIQLSLKDVSIERAVDVLNTVLDVYTSRWVDDKNRMAVATSHFITERLALIEKQLGGVDSDIMEYRSDHLITDIQEAAKLNMQSSQKNKDDAIALATQLEMAKFMMDFVRKPSNQNSVIPINTGVGNLQLEQQIGQYNSILLTRNNVEASSSASNPLVRDYDAQLKGMREAITTSIENQVVNLQNGLRNLNRETDNLRGELANAPKQAKQLLSVERQQKVLEQLYLYLLQKREENQLTQTFTADSTRVITPPMGSNNPVSPKQGMTLVLAFIFGLALPMAAVYAQESLNTKVRSRKDLDQLATPFVGEIPFVGKNGKFAKVFKKFKRKKGGKQLETLTATVQPGSRDVLNESFRIVRGNLDFMFRRHPGNVLMVTSFNPGSGKSFVTYNLAAMFAMKGRKVLIIDCDLRHGSSSQFVGMPGKGVSSYLTGSSDDWQKLVVPTDSPDLYMLPIGHRPPNPAEMLEGDRMKTLVQQASREYDYVLLDCPPVDVVVDTQMLAPLANRTLFVVRAGLLEKVDVPEIDNLYRNRRFNQMSIVLNGTERQFSRYGSEGRGYYSSEL